jgi:hypothetical protein
MPVAFSTRGASPPAHFAPRSPHFAIANPKSEIRNSKSPGLTPRVARIYIVRSWSDLGPLATSLKKAKDAAEESLLPTPRIPRGVFFFAR